LEPGRFYVLRGENGAGKSTLLRMIAGLNEPTEGNILIYGIPNKQALERMGYMAHAPLLYDELSGMENLRFFAQLYGVKSDAPLAQAMQRVGLDDKLERRVGQYSQGMRRGYRWRAPFPPAAPAAARRAIFQRRSRFRFADCQTSSGHALGRNYHFAGHAPDRIAGQPGGRISHALARAAGRSRLHAWDSTMKVAMQQGQPLAPPARMSIARLTWINVTKDLRLEWRSRDVFNSMMFFALVVVVVFSFSSNAKTLVR